MKASILSLLPAVALGAIAADLVTTLPGWGAPLTKTYSGYLNISGGKHLHYLFIQSQSANPMQDPVALWLNGGPGCSSLEGAFNEQGPLWTIAGGNSLQNNSYTWNKMMNLLYLEAPACVGFSYADDPNSGCVHDDTSTAVDNLNAVVEWFAAYKEYAALPFYITGESYAGIYIPMLSLNIVNYNKAAPALPINLVGIIVGNGCIGYAAGVCGPNGYADYLSLTQLWGHGFISNKAYDSALSLCGDWSDESPACNDAIGNALNAVGDIDIYDIYSGVYGICNYGNLKGSPVPATGGKPRAPRRPIAKNSVASHLSLGNTCTTDSDLETYMNRVDVQTALHVKTTDWAVCSNIDYTQTMADERVSVYPTLVASGLKVYIVSGEADACVPLTDSQWWTTSMNYTETSAWTSWTASDGTVGGYITQYKAPGAFALVTVRGSGHMIPQQQPMYSLELVTKIVTGTSF